MRQESITQADAELTVKFPVINRATSLGWIAGLFEGLYLIFKPWNYKRSRE